MTTTLNFLVHFYGRWYSVKRERGEESRGKTESREGQKFVIALVCEQVGSFVRHFSTTQFLGKGPSCLRSLPITYFNLEFEKK